MLSRGVPRAELEQWAGDLIDLHRECCSGGKLAAVLSRLFDPTVDSEAELHAMPVGARVRDSDDDVWTKTDDDGKWMCRNGDVTRRAADVLTFSPLWLEP